MPTPNFHDLPDGSSIINHTSSREIASEYICECPPPPPPVNFEITENPFLPHTFPANAGETVRRPQPITNGSLNTAIGASALAQTPASPPPNPVGYSSEFPPHPSYADGPAWSTAPIDLSPQVCDPSPPRRSRRRREISDPDAAIRKDPNAWSLREAVELCKLLEVVVPEAGFHIALTGGLLYKEGRRKDCDLMFYQIRQMEPNYEILWKYLTVAGVIRSPSYPENGWLVKATYRGKAVDCLFPNAKKVKKVTMGDLSTKQNAYQTSPPTPVEQATDAARQEEMRLAPMTTVDASIMRALGVAAGQAEAERLLEGCSTESERQRPSVPIIYRRSPSGPVPYDPAELLATPAPAPIPAVEQ